MACCAEQADAAGYTPAAPCLNPGSTGDLPGDEGRRAADRQLDLVRPVPRRDRRAVIPTA